ncbi:MAG: class I SAM-dependent methyltransferase [Elusimicrobiota bacterium]
MTDPLARCPFCGGSQVGWRFFAKGLPPGARPFELLSCGSCGLGWTSPALPEHEMAPWYPPAYYGRENVRFHWSLESLVRLFRRRRALAVSRRCRLGPVLDVGCGRGILLSHLRELGYEPYGVEISEHAAWNARNRGAKVHVGSFMTAPYGAEQFHAVIFWHVLEHMGNPFAALRHAHALLKKGGLLAVAVPNLDSLQARFSGRNWFHLDIPRHYYHFSRRSLEAALRKSGFRPVETAHFSFEQNPYGWLQSLFNALGFRFNFLYDILKNRSSRTTPLRRHPFQALLIAALLPALVPLAVLLTVLEAALQCGGTIEMYAVKE